MAAYEAIVPYGWEDRLPWLDLAFPVEEYAARVARVRALLAREGLDALLAFGGGADHSNVRWLANFEPAYGDNVVVVPAAGEPMLSTNWLMHGEPMHTSIWTTWIRDVRPGERPGMARQPATSVEGQVAERLAEGGLARGRIGLAGLDAASAAFVPRLQALLPEVEWVPADRLMLEARAIKSQAEIAVMREAGRISGDMHRVALAYCRPGITEWAVVAEAHKVCYEQGGELAFSSAVTAGLRAGLKHCAPSRRPMAHGDMVFLDMAARVKGYHADVSRCTVVGPPSAEQRHLLETGLAMFEAVVAAIKPGVYVPDLHRIATAIARRAGYDREIMPKGFGHGLGTSVYEWPQVRLVSDTVLQAGMVFALEPMLVKHNVGTACVEETVLVTETGCELLAANCPLRTW